MAILRQTEIKEICGKYSDFFHLDIFFIETKIEENVSLKCNENFECLLLKNENYLEENNYL